MQFILLEGDILINLNYNKMKIAMFCDVFLPKVDGAIVATLSLAKNLADNGNKVFIIAPKFKNIEKEFRYKNIKVIRVFSIPALFYEDFKFTFLFNNSVYKFLKKEKVDLIHVQAPLTLGINGLFISKLLKIPLIGTFHTNPADPNCLKHVKLNYFWVSKLIWVWLRFFYNFCDIVTCPSLSCKNDLLYNGINRLVKIISSGVDSRIFDNSNARKLREKLNKHGKILLFVGRISHEKNISYLLDCFNLSLKKIPNLKLIIVGNGPQMNEVKQKVNSLGISKKVIFTGMIRHDLFVKSSIYGASDLFVTASSTETQGISTLEAQANGLVCIGLNVPGTQDIIKNNWNGFLIEKGDKNAFSEAIIKVLSNPKLYSKFRKNTLIGVKQHETANVMRIWDETFKNLIGNKNER